MYRVRYRKSWAEPWSFTDPLDKFKALRVEADYRSKGYDAHLTWGVW